MRRARLGVRVIDRCNLTILNEPGYEDLGEFPRGRRRGDNRFAAVLSRRKTSIGSAATRVYESSILGLRKLNALGYGQDGGSLVLNLVYNPLGATLPPPQPALEATYKRELAARFGITFNALFTLANMPIPASARHWCRRAGSRRTCTPCGPRTIPPMSTA